MNSTGIIRKIDDLGRIVLPREMRRSLGLRDGTPIEMLISGNAIVLKKYYPEKKLSEMIQEMEEAVEEMESNLGVETFNVIKRNIQEIQMFLKAENPCTDMNLDITRYECPVCKNEQIKPGQTYCQICGNPIDWKEDQEKVTK